MSGQRLTLPQFRLLERAIAAADSKRGTLKLFDGRLWPAVRKLRDLGLIAVEDYHWTHHDIIEIRATNAAQDAADADLRASLAGQP
ncbi:MAG: hypothetical protein ACM3W4_01640 [Ignavibacteriales bacterium]